MVLSLHGLKMRWQGDTSQSLVHHDLLGIWIHTHITMPLSLSLSLHLHHLLLLPILQRRSLLQVMGIIHYARIRTDGQIVGNLGKMGGDVIVARAARAVLTMH